MEKFDTSVTQVTENIFLIDWLTVVYHGCTVDEVKESLGLLSSKIPWVDVEKYRNGYPCQSFWNGITISYGADDPAYAKDPTKVRSDMGICLNLSGTGCRAFESHGHGDWFRLLQLYFTLNYKVPGGVREKNGQQYSYHITRLDLAFDDHMGILDIYQLKRDTEDRYYISKSKYAEILWSDHQEEDIQGLTIQIGSDKSDIKTRIYDKAAERGFKDRHWIRIEIQLRDERAEAAAFDLVKNANIGYTFSGILNNYLSFRSPTEDTNKSRWPVADYWLALLTTMDLIKLWTSPGEEYNFAKTEYWLIKQYGQAIRVLDIIYDPDYLIQRCRELYPFDDLAAKYRNVVKEVFTDLPDLPEV